MNDVLALERERVVAPSDVIESSVGVSFFKI